jgi:hypothetical protein
MAKREIEEGATLGNDKGEAVVPSCLQNVAMLFQMLNSIEVAVVARDCFDFKRENIFQKRVLL